YGQLTDMPPWPLRLPEPDELDVNFGRRLDMLLHLKLSANHYVTFNAISSASTILFGVLAGELLRGPASFGKKLGVLTAAGFLGLAVGFLMSGGDERLFTLPVLIPMIKRLWTASFTIFAAGWTCLMLAAFYGIVEGLGFKKWTF